MTETTKIEIPVQYLDTLLLEYYKKYFQGENIELKRIIHSDGHVDDYVTTVIIRKVNIGNYIGEKKYKLTDDEIKNVINEDLKQQNYEINYFNYIVIDSKLVTLQADIKQVKKEKQKTL